jgi:translation initiation factor 3 subunit K
MAKEAQPQVSYTVEELVEVNPYNPDILSDLENYVNEQVSFSFLSSNSQLCLYSFNYLLFSRGLFCLI